MRFPPDAIEEYEVSSIDKSSGAVIVVGSGKVVSGIIAGASA